jgi:hypothetical protein
MTHVSRNANREASLELSLQAHKGLLAEYSQRTQQAEQAVSLMMREKMDADGIEKFATLVAAHLESRANQLAVHQQALLQTTLVALNSAAPLDDATLRHTVNSIQKALTMSLAQMNQSQGRASRPTHPTQE